MTTEEAIARMRERWSRPPPSRVDVEERVALRFADDPAAPEIRILSCCCSVRIFMRRTGAWVSRYVHGVEDTDGVVEWILAHKTLTNGKQAIG